MNLGEQRHKKSTFLILFFLSFSVFPTYIFIYQENMEKQVLNHTVFSPRFTHIMKQIFEQLDKKTITKCREVSKSWQQFVDNENLPLAQIINIPEP